MGSVKVDANDKETQQYLSLMKKLDNLKVFTTSSPKLSADMKLTADKYMKTAGLEELMRVNDSGKNVKIWVKSGSTDTQVKELLKYNQEDFKIKIERKKGEVPPPPPCMISDSTSYRITFIQNDKQNSYGQYAPKYYYEKCTMKTINKPILKKFIDVIDLL